MAGEIVQTLFGVSPESYQQQQSALADQQALQYARLSPFQQANYAIGRGAYQIAGALGGEDPELQLISARNSIAKQINFSDLNSIAQGIQMLGNAGDTVGMMQLADVYRKAQESSALVTQRQREALTPEQRNSDAYAKQFGAPGSPEYQAAFKQRFDALTLKETNISFGGDREAASLELFGKKYIDLSQAERAEVNKSLVKPEPSPNVGPEREAISMANFGKPFAKLDQTQQQAVNLAIEKPEPSPNVGPEREAISMANFGKPFAKLDQTQQQAVNLAIVKPEPTPSFGDDREAASFEMYGVPFVKLTQQQKASVNRSLIKPEKAEPAPTFGNEREAEAFANFGKPFASLSQQQQAFVNSKVAKPEPVATFGNEREAEAQANFGTSFGSLNRSQQEFVNKIVGKTAGGVTFGTDANRISLELFGKPFGDLSQSEQAAVNKRVEGEKKASAPNLTVVNAVQKGFGDNLTETITTTVKAGRVARQTLGAVNNMQALLDEGVRTGFGQDTMLQVGKVGQLLNPDFNVKGLAGAEALQSISTNLVLPQVKQLGVNPTDTDLKFINTGSPGLSKTVAGNKLMLSTLSLKLEREQDAAAFTNNWLGQNAKLTTTNPTDAFVKYNSDYDKYVQSSPLYAPAANKLREQFNALNRTAPGGRAAPTARDATNRGGLTRP